MPKGPKGQKRPADEMDRTGKVDGAYRKLKQRRNESPVSGSQF